ncbi:hypothetical protein TRVL_00844 [Trypanosoma vivax]|nr:hypothetical protein TRVL_00844 [Trypanosoma vivax]
MGGDLLECIRTVLSCASHDGGDMQSALEDVHKIVFGFSTTTDIPVTPRGLISSSEAAVTQVGGDLSRRKPSSAAGLPIEAVIVEVLARLSRILLTNMIPSQGASSDPELRVVKEDRKHLEMVLLPRFFLKLPVSPEMLRDVMMKAPWELFSRKYGVEHLEKGAGDHVPTLVADALNSFKTNFGCDFLLNIRTESDHPTMCVGRSEYPICKASSYTIPLCEQSVNVTMHSGVKEVTETFNSGDGVPTERDLNVEPSFSKMQTKRGPSVLGKARCDAPYAFPRRKMTTEFDRAWASQSVNPACRLPTYMLRKRPLGMFPVSKYSARNTTGHFCAEENQNSVSQVTSSLTDDDSDAEILATESPVRRRVRVENDTVPPSPFRPGRLSDSSAS